MRITPRQQPGAFIITVVHHLFPLRVHYVVKAHIAPLRGTVMTYGQGDGQQYGEQWQPQPNEPGAHRRRTQGSPQAWQDAAIKSSPTIAAIAAVLAIAGCSAATSTVYRTVPPQRPAATMAATPATAATAAASSPAAPRTVTKVMSGSGDYTSGPLHFGCVIDGNPITVKYRYSGNSLMGNGTNFSAELDGTNGVEMGNGGSFVNDIAESGSKTTYIYPSQFDLPPFHLVIYAAPGARWKFTFTCDAS
jgi:hypothetical protein